MSTFTPEEMLLPFTIVVLALLLGIALSWGLRSREKLRAILSPPRLPANSKTASVVLLGLGGVGKTSLAYAISERQFEAKALTTLSAKQVEATWIQPDKTRMFLNMMDGPGAHLSELVGQLVDAQREPYSAFRRGQITSFILMVDLVRPEKPAKPPSITEMMVPDRDRIAQHLNAWQESVLEAVIGFANPRVQFILFINKLDLVKVAGEASKEHFTPIVNRLRKVGIHDVRVIEGSALTGQGLKDLRKALYDSASRPGHRGMASGSR